MSRARPSSRASALAPRARRRAFATVLVFAVIVFAVIILGVTQTAAFAHASAGRESLARVRAAWAARAGLECTIARLEHETQEPELDNAFSLLVRMTEVAQGDLPGASWSIAHWEGQREVPGPEDAHAKLNINRLTLQQLAAIEPFMPEDAQQSILDWIDPDEDAQPLGAEAPYYLALPHPYEPRNGPMKSLAELELVAGVDARDVRGEDWNLNGLLDPNEDDGDASWPPDNADGVLDGSWSSILTAQSAEGSLSPAGQPRLDLQAAKDADLVSRLGVNAEQAKAILAHVDSSASASLRDFILTDLNTLAARAAQASGQQGQRARVEALTRAQLGALLEETSIGPAQVGAFFPGKLNVNTCEADVLRFIPELTPETADAIIGERAGLPDGFASLGDLLQVPGIGRRQLAAIYELLCVRSTAFIVTSRGRDERSGVEVEVRAVLDRSSLPVIIQEVRVR
jgi:type II secretory pathway component PulK